MKVLSQKTIHLRACKDREVRDLYNVLMKKYRSPLVHEFFERHYFIQESHLMQIISRVDKKPIDLEKASHQYLAAITPGFNLS